MSALIPVSARFDVQGLAGAVTLSTASDRMNLTLSDAQWQTLGSYMQPFVLARGEMLINEGAAERTLYFVESGSLSVHREDSKGRVRLAILGPGTVVGEGGFFAQSPRLANVQAASESRLWCLAPMRFVEMAHRHPALALDLCMGLGNVLAKRLFNRPRRMAVT